MVLTLRKLRDYFRGTNNMELFNVNLTTAQKNKADFKAWIPDLDTWLYTWYQDMGVQKDPDFDAQIGSTYVLYLSAWWDLRVADFNRVYSALTQEYDALADYWMKEHSGEVRKVADYESKSQNGGTLTQTYAQRDNTQYSSTNEDTALADAKFDSKSTSTVANTGDVSTDARSTTTTNKYKSSDKQVVIDNDTTIEGNEAREKYIHKEGNTGDKPIQEILEKELQIRKTSFAKYFGECFARECTTGSWCIDDDFYEC